VTLTDISYSEEEDEEEEILDGETASDIEATAEQE
jgi:hypothetical protein